MKDKNRLNIITSLVAAMFILSLFTGIAMAQAPEEQYEKAKEKDQMQKEKYQNTQKKFEEAKELFEKARERLRDAKDSKSREELKLKTREYLLRAVDHTVSHLEILKSRAELSENKDASKNLDAHIAQLEQIRTKVQQANTTQEFRDAFKELKELWAKIRLETRYYIGIVLNHRIDQFIAKADNVSSRIDAAIQNLKSQGKDTAQLEDEAARFNNLVMEAKDHQQKTVDLFAGHGGFSSNGTVANEKDAAAFVRQASELQKETIKKLRAASKELLDFARDWRKQSGGKVVVSGTGTLMANGSGRAIIEGNVIVTLSGINGTLKVSSNSNVITDGTGTKEVLGNGDVKYQGFGSATITGENIRIEVSGNNIKLTATGTGSAILSGHGRFRTEKDFGVSSEWNKEV